MRGYSRLVGSMLARGSQYSRLLCGRQCGGGTISFDCAHGWVCHYLSCYQLSLGSRTRVAGAVRCTTPMASILAFAGWATAGDSGRRGTMQYRRCYCMRSGGLATLRRRCLLGQVTGLVQLASLLMGVVGEQIWCYHTSMQGVTIQIHVL